MKQEASADWASVEEDENGKAHRNVVDGGGYRVTGSYSVNSEFETQQFDFLSLTSQSHTLQYARSYCCSYHCKRTL